MEGEDNCMRVVGEGEEGRRGGGEGEEGGEGGEGGGGVRIVQEN